MMPQQISLRGGSEFDMMQSLISKLGLRAHPEIGLPTDLGRKPKLPANPFQHSQIKILCIQLSAQSVSGLPEIAQSEFRSCNGHGIWTSIPFGTTRY
jgi:hypothetical protein